MTLFLLEMGKGQYFKDHKAEGTRCLADFSIQMHEAGMTFDHKAYCNFFLRILKDKEDTMQRSKLASKLSEDTQVQAIRALGRLGEWTEHAEALLDFLEDSSHSARLKWNTLTALQGLLSRGIPIHTVEVDVQFNRLLRLCKELFEEEENWKVRIAILRFVPDIQQTLIKGQVSTDATNDLLLSLLAAASKVEVPLEHKHDYLASLNLATSS
jgi:hypothetical protein